VVYGAGETLLAEVRPGQVDPWLTAGWIVPVETKGTARKRGSVSGTTATSGTVVGKASPATGAETADK
jgi:hypothetical protein